MTYQNSPEDERFLEKMEKEEKEMLLKYYGLNKTDSNCPLNAYLLYPNRLHLTSYEVLSDGKIKLNIGYTRNWSGFVRADLRLNYTQYILGTIYCENVSGYEIVKFNKTGSIKLPFFSKSKILSLPINDNHNVKIECTKITVENIDIYVKESDGNFKLDREFIKEINHNQ